MRARLFVLACTLLFDSWLVVAQDFAVAQSVVTSVPGSATDVRQENDPSWRTFYGEVIDLTPPAPTESTVPDKVDAPVDSPEQTVGSNLSEISDNTLEAQISNSALLSPTQLVPEVGAGLPITLHKSPPVCKVALTEKRECKDSEKLATILSVAVFGGQLSDWITTRYAISKGAREANPLMKWVVNHEPAGIGVKLGVTYFVSYMTRKALREAKPRKRIAAIIVTGLNVGLSAFVSMHNLSVAHKMTLRHRR